MAARRILAIERGQGTVEWIALLLLVSLALAAIAALIGIGVPGAGLARAVAARIVCAVGLGGDCDPGRARLVEAYGGEIGPLVADHAPTILYEPGMRALPVDYRRCREDACAEGVEAGRVWRSGSGEPAAAFVHAIDCRAGTAAAPSGVDCSGERDGNLYLQYWLYYPGSATGEGSTPLRGVIREVSTAVGRPSYHPDDWEAT